ncbi:MAG: glycosyltransferase family 9 protein, partial [Rudaea sp.]
GLADDLRRRELDAAFIFTSFSQSPYPPAYACYLAGIPARIGQSKEFGGSVLSTWVKPLPDPTHQVDRNLHLVSSVGIELAGQRMELAIPDKVQERADALLATHGIDPDQPFLLLAPGASCEARRYDPVRLGVVAEKLLETGALPLVVVGSERERPLFQPILTASPRGIVDLVGQTSVPELAAVIRRARLVIANNSGPMHMADAFERPIVLLYSGTEHESQWQPRFAPVELLRRPTDCSPCYAFKCPYHMECLDIDPMTVVGSAIGLLARTGQAADHLLAERL